LLHSLPKVVPDLPREFQRQIAALTELAVRGRTHVPGAGYSKDIICVHEPEAATRLAQQLAQLAKGSSLLDGRNVVSEEDCKLVRRVAFDCIPAVRRKILEALISGQSLKGLELPNSTLSYAKEDLQSQGFIEGQGLSQLALQHLREAGMR